MTIEDHLEKKFLLLLSRKLKNIDVSADINSMNQDELVAFQEWVGQVKQKSEEKIWYEKQEQRAEDFARKFGISNKPECNA